MKYNTIRIAMSMFVLSLSYDASSQGCSDAGFCTIGNLKQLQKEDSENPSHSKLSLLLPVGIGDDDVLVFTPGIQYDNRFSDQWAIQAKLTANYANGNLGSATGIGDVFLSGIYILKSKSSWKTSLVLGAKLPLNQGNIKEKELSLPMQYQSSLGTIDLITGINVTNNKWQFAAGWQQPLSGRNRNNFLPVYWDDTNAIKYPPSNDFNRKGDVLVRTAYSFNANKKLLLNGGVLAIYHLGKDTYIDANVSNNPILIEGSDGLTLNLTVAAWLQLNQKITIGLTGGAPLVVRDIRPDGLTRSIVISPEIIFNF